MKHSSEKIRRPPDSKLKKYRLCIHSKILSATQPLNRCYKTSHQTPRLGHSFESSVLCVPFAWQSDKPTLLYFTPNSASETQFGTGTQRLSFQHQVHGPLGCKYKPAKIIYKTICVPCGFIMLSNVHRLKNDKR